ncbi:G-protein coupled receptor Mth2-like [Condylostylus longicornis]|uniref:G-protein coupled receptor Mth2-like n=1 Tax=Condylostylus longicornis TaxID=2530218 RepID=UPI00244DA04B|nr:G-protein coupled receptor Mth2-like [Condylostylus longicornis]
MISYNITILLVLLISLNIFAQDSNTFPCEIDESIELNLNEKQLDDSYIADDIRIPKEYIFKTIDNTTNETITRGSFLLSQPFMIITIIVYLAIKKLRNLHGKALVCHLSSLSISYFCLAGILLGNNRDYFEVCTVIGYICYFTILSAYFWLSAISFDLWFNFNCYDKAKSCQNFRFGIYCLICYGTAIFYVIIAYIVQNYGKKDNVKPGLGSTHCYLNVEEGFSAVIWLYFPLICVITFNIVMFVLTWIKIKSVTSELGHIMNKGNSQRSIKNERNNFHIFLRLFVIMGVSWITEIISYFVGTNYQEYFYATDFCNAMQGLLIFILFVCKKQTRELIVETWSKRNQGSERSESRFISKPTRKWMSKFKKSKNIDESSLSTQTTNVSQNSI